MFFPNALRTKETAGKVTFERSGFVVLNFLGTLWVEKVFPTEDAARAGIKAALGEFATAELTIVPARQAITWERP